MQRFDLLRDGFKSTVGLIAGSLTILLFVRELLTLTLGNTLRTAVLIALAGLYLGLSAMERDVEDNIHELQDELNRGFDKVEALIRAREMNEDVKTDGAGEPVREDAGSSGYGALGGMIAVGALGLPFGTAGAVVGGLLGALIGNEIEYQDIKDRRRARR